MRTMKVAVFIRPGKIELTEKPIPIAGLGEAVLRISTTTICGTYVHILKGEFPVEAGRTIGHEPVGVITELGAGVNGIAAGIAALKRSGVRIVMLTGDSHSAAEAVARQLGIDEVLAESLPEDKAGHVKRLQAEGRKVAMAGDGINDAPALAHR